MQSHKKRESFGNYDDSSIIGDTNYGRYRGLIDRIKRGVTRFQRFAHREETLFCPQREQIKSIPKIVFDR